MCLIVDANLAAVVFGDRLLDDFRPLIDWLTNTKKNGRLVVGGHLANELNQINAVQRFVRALLQAGRARVIPSAMTDEEVRLIADLCESDDPHVIALARVSGARILCSRDRTLHRDFTNRNLISGPRGHVYQNAEHKHLLRSYGHTEACRRSIG